MILSDALPGRPGALVAGRASASQPFSGGTLLVDEPDVLARFTVGADGTAVIPVPLGGRPGLVGKEIYLQALFSDPSEEGPASMSEGLHADVCQ